jgi:hypothetical protein
MGKSKLLISLLFTTVLACFAQSGTGTLSGRVTAASGAGVPNAAVIVTNASSNASQRTLTAPDGSFSLAGIAPGTYRVEVESAGYKRASQNSVALTAGSTAALNIALEAGSITETVEIKAVAPGVQSDSVERGMGLGTKPVRETPVVDRNHDQLNGLNPGVTPPQPALDMVRDPARSRFFSTNGQSPTANTPYMDGVSNIEPYRGTPLHAQAAESVQQMNMVNGQYMAERGFVGGTWENHVTRGGTNDWHGSAYEFHSNNNLRARNFFNTPGNSDPKSVYNQFGGTVGGRLIRDRTFFFGSYEGTYNRGGNTAVTTVPLPEALTGNFAGIEGLQLYNPATGTFPGTLRSPFVGNIIPASRINPTAALIASYLPAPNAPGLVNNYVSNVPARNDGNRFDGRLDHRFNEGVSGFLRYGYSNYLTSQGSPLGSVIGAGTRGRLIAQSAVANVTWNRPTLISELRLGYNRYDQKLRAENEQFLLGNALGGSFNSNLVGININGLAPIGTPSNVPMRGVDNNYNAAASWNWHHGMHNVKFGAEGRHFQANGFMDNLFGPNGTAFFGPGATMLSGGPAMSQYGNLYNSLAAFLLGAPTQVGFTQYAETPTWRQWQTAAWVEDRINLMQRLTLTLGLRYDLFSPIEPSRAGGAQFFDPSTNTFNYAGLNGTPMTGTRWNLGNVAPRIGMAFRATQKTVLRGGYAITYFESPFQFSGFTPSTVAAVAGVAGTYAVAPFQGPFGPTLSFGSSPALQNGAATGNQPVSYVPRDRKTPSVQQFSFGIQQDFYAGTVLDVAYVGTLGRHLPGITEMNAALPGAGLAGLPYAALGRTGSVREYNNFLTNNYNSLQVSLNRRFAQGLSFTAAYTFSKALGYTDANGMLLNPFDRQANYGLQPYDRQHVFTVSHLWELPFGAGTPHLNRGWVGQVLGNWQINGVFTWDSGTPLTVTTDPLLCACPGNTVLANYQGSGAVLSNGLNYLNPSAVSVPANQFGTGGRSSLRANGFRNYDLSLFRSFPWRQFKLEFRGEAYNLTNTPRFASPVTNLNSPDFGRITSTVNGAFGRQVNLAVRLLF